MDWCAICGSHTHHWYSVGPHTDEEKSAYADKVIAAIRRKRSNELRAAYDLVAKDIKKRPRNMLKLTKRLGGKS